MNDKQKLANDMHILRKLNENMDQPPEHVKVNDKYAVVSQVGSVQEEVTYDSLWKELSQVVSGDAIPKVLEILKNHNLIQGDLQDNVEWIFNFQGGGWNTEMAKTKEQAIAQAHAKYDDSEHTVVMDDSFRPSTQTDKEMNLRNFD